jgi:hypothetical protein
MCHGRECHQAAVQGPGEDECRALLASAGDAARQLETSIAGDEVCARPAARCKHPCTCWLHMPSCVC